MSIYQDWAASVEALNIISDHRKLPDGEIPVTWKVVNIHGEVVPGFITFEVGFIDPDGNLLSELTRGVSLSIPAELAAEAADLLAGDPSDQSITDLMTYMQSHTAFQANIMTSFTKPAEA